MKTGTIIFGILTLISAGSLLIKRPWTIIVARRSTSPDVWSTDLFLETNMIITGGWAILFGGAAVLAAIAPTWVNIIYGAFLFILGVLSSRFGSWYSNRRLRATGLLDDESEDKEDVDIS